MAHALVVGAGIAGEALAVALARTDGGSPWSKSRRRSVPAVRRSTCAVTPVRSWSIWG